MTEFKVGDKVRVKGNTFAPNVEAGSVHVIDRVIDEPAIYRFVIDYDETDWAFLADELELITPQKEATVAFDISNPRKHTGHNVIVERNHEEHERPKDFVYIKDAEHFGERFTFDVREVPEVIKALQSVYDDYQQMLEAAKPKVEDVLNGLGIGAVVRTDVGFKFVKAPDGRWAGEFQTNVRARDFGDTMDGIEILSEGVHLD